MEEIDNNSHVAGLLAYHLVNLVLQEGCMIANAALESGCPREYLSTRINVRSDLTYVIHAREDATYVDKEVDNAIEGPDNAKMESELNVLVTSTPQKVADDKPKKENGQGDEPDTEPQENELNNSTSLFINHLFDISDVELGISDIRNPLPNTEYNSFLPPLISSVMDFYMNAALDAFRASQKQEESVGKRVKISGNSSFSCIEEAVGSGEDVVFYVDDVDDDLPCTENVYEIPQDPMTSQMALQCALTKDIRTENSELYENTYLTLNRDYDQCSDEEEFPILEDPKGMLMQEIALLTADSSIDSGRSYNEPDKDIQIDKKPREGLAATSGVSAGSRKSGLVRRWRLQGARFLACIRGWWRRKATGKRKAAGSPGQRPLSPSARRRAASLLDQRVSSTVPCSAKCNTINEALLNSQHWMDYTFETKLNDCGDV